MVRKIRDPKSMKLAPSIF
ncbi:Protein of unknown function [Bacillus mycoides]|nr:Protein of unknown function [Bacillus mycoides]